MIQGNEAYIQEFLESSQIKPLFEDVKRRTSEQILNRINGFFSFQLGGNLRSALTGLRDSSSNIFNAQTIRGHPSCISQELFEQWVSQNKPARYANLKVYIEQIKIFSLQQAQTALVEHAAEDNDLLGNSFDIYLQNALNQAIDLTKRMLEDNKAAVRDQKLKILSQCAGGGLLNFFQYFCTRYHGYQDQLADFIDAFFDFAGDDFELKVTVISAIHYSVGISKNNYMDDSFLAYRENMPVILSKLFNIIHYIYLHQKTFPPLSVYFMNMDCFLSKKLNLKKKFQIY